MPSHCLTEDQLEQLVRSPTSVPDGAESHLSVCQSCQQALEQITSEIRPDGPCPTALGHMGSHITWNSNDETATDRPNQGERVAVAGKLPAAIGSFNIVGLLGQGGMGIVYRAEDTRLQRTVAIKVLHDHIAADPALQARLLTEAQAVARIEHDNVVTVHAVEEGNGTPYLVMQHVRGGPLSSRIEDGPLDVQR